VGVAAAAAAAAPWAPLAGIAAFGVAVALLLKRVLDTPSRKYDPRDVNVGREYDNWTQEGVLEYYWGEHIHLGYYSHELRRRGRYTNGDFIRAKIDFVDQMFKWSGAPPPDTLLDVGCGIGGTSRQLAERFPHAKVTGITLSPKQVERGTELAKERGISNCEFKVMDALKMDFPDNSFDIVWGCESGEHMPDKRRYIEEMVRVLKPGGTLVIATWCQREATPDRPLTPKEKDKLQFLYDEWAHPYFISKEEYVRIMDGTNQLEEIRYDDWNEFTIDSWRHSIWVGVRDPMGLLCKSPLVWYRSLRDAVTLERMHRAFASGLMEYGMLKARKKVPLVGTRV
jgi:MPBQ/MSBQ methyltransferase